MSLKSVIGATCVSLAVFSFNTSAAIVSIDWLSTGDNLITRDTVSGLNWLDLTETNGMTFEYVSTQLGTGGQFSGFRYATSAEVVTLWSNFGIDLSEGTTSYNSSYIDTNIDTISSVIGNIFHEINPAYPAGARGVTSDVGSHGNGYHDLMGAHRSEIDTWYYGVGEIDIYDMNSSIGIGHYLVMPTTVPVPAAAWLFGSGLLGLIGISRRKKAA